MVSVGLKEFIDLLRALEKILCLPVGMIFIGARSILVKDEKWR